MQPLYESLMRDGLIHEAYRGLDNLGQIYQNINREINTLYIIDDLMMDVINSKLVCDLVTRGSHHDNLSIIIVYHNLLPQGKYARTIGMNAQYLVAFYNYKTAKQFNTLVRERKQPNRLISMYNAMEHADHPRPLVIDNRENRAWFGLCPEQVYDLTTVV